MDGHGWVAIAVLVVATVLFIKKWLPVGVTALSIPVVLHVTGVLPKASDALRGFSSPAAVAIGAVFVLGTGLRESGVATLLARGIQALGGRSEARLCLDRALSPVPCGPDIRRDCTLPGARLPPIR